VPVYNKGYDKSKDNLKKRGCKYKHESIDQGMARYFVTQQLSVVIKSCEGLSQPWQSQDDFVKTEIHGMGNGKKGKHKDEQKAGD
jgi:hypothetical protein